MPAPVERLEARGARIHFDPTLPADLARRWLDEHGAWFGPERRPLAGAEGRPDLARVESPLGALVAKRAPLPSLPRRSRPERAFAMGRAWSAAGLRTPEPLAWIELRSERAAVLVTRFVAGRDPWSSLAAARDGAPSAAFDELLEALAAAIAEVHARRFRHRDLKAPNLLVVRGESGALQVVFVDLDGATSAAPRRSIRTRDLARLCVSFHSRAARAAGVRADAWPLLVERYVARAGLARSESDRIRGWTERWASRHIERNLLRERPIA
jgi:tRNA A-37 threonylcarbamoyl transferase component Bud32